MRVSVSSSGVEGNDHSLVTSMTPDGRYVAFESVARNLAIRDTHGYFNVYVRDRLLGTTELISASTDGTNANGNSNGGSLSADGRYVSFSSDASNLVPGDTNGKKDAFVRDRTTGRTICTSVDPTGAPGNDFSFGLRMSADGRFVGIGSLATNLIAGHTVPGPQVYLRDLLTGTTELISVGIAGQLPNSDGTGFSISADGRFVAFSSRSTNLVQHDSNGGIQDVFVRDRLNQTTELASVNSSGAQGGGSSLYQSISADGRYVSFVSYSDLVSGDTNGIPDVFIHDRQTGITERVSVDSNGVQGNGSCDCGDDVQLSFDGRFVVFRSLASNLVDGDTNREWDVFLRDRVQGTTERVSLGSEGQQGPFGGADPQVSDDGRFVAFTSFSSNLVPGDSNGVNDAFVRDRSGGPNFLSRCDPGVGRVIACPCANPPSGPGRGCDNSGGTGGAVLSATGGTSLSSDSLVFATSGERPTATSVLLQGNVFYGSGIVYGQGLRCVGGTFKRLYNRMASGGSITAPDFGAGELSVSARSAAIGVPISPGQSRWYIVLYRDPFVLGGCPLGHTYNATQTGQVTWSP